MNKTLLTYILLILMISQPATATQAVVKDGDSLEIENKRIRLDGIDAPEFTQTCQTKDGSDYDCGIKSRQYLDNLVNGKEITCHCLPDKDRYNREICECFVDKISLNKAMVAAGWAVAYRKKKFLNEESKAKENKLGIWQGKHMKPAIYRALHKANFKNHP